MKKVFLISFLFCSYFIYAQVPDMLLNGKWQMGLDRNYTSSVDVPGIATDPTKMTEGKLWYKRTILLPKGDWTKATLVLMGARFMPEVYVDGEKVSHKNGGMTVTYHLLSHKNVQPGKEITIEVALNSLKDLPSTDASFIPKADQWRSNCSSSIWDDVFIHFHCDKRIETIIPYYNIEKKTIDIRSDFVNFENSSKVGYEARIFDLKGKVLLTDNGKCNSNSVQIHFDYINKLSEWTTDSPRLYRLEIKLIDGKKIIDNRSVNIGIKVFSEKNKQFYINGLPCKLRGGTIVWHRWVRSPEGRVLGYNVDWFTENIIKRLKDHGANYIRFHLGVPPQRLLDLCDKYGLLVQYEWSFFHGMPASYESLMEQYPAWFNLSMAHPSIAIYHPYNETEGEQLKIEWKALNKIVLNYPPLVMEERDIIHVHKYWWSLFENVGIYYDDANQFDKAIMVDEFGGNYLDEKGNLGGYKSLKESYMRFIGRTNTADERLKFQAVSCAKIGEYWRRIGAAGVAPFAIASSWEDGNTWFMGALTDGNPKPVWNALTALYSPLSVSIDLWDCNFQPGQTINFPLFFFNDTNKDTLLMAKVWMEDKTGKNYNVQYVNTKINAFQHLSKEIRIAVPLFEGQFALKAELIDKLSLLSRSQVPRHITNNSDKFDESENNNYSIVSSWDIRTFLAKVPVNLSKISVSVADNEPELLKMFTAKGVQISSVSDKNTKLIIGSLNTWKRIVSGDLKTKKMILDAIKNGVSVLLLDIGERNLGQGYPIKKGDLGNLQGVTKIDNPKITKYEILDGIDLICTEAVEPESHLHAALENNVLWKNLPKEYTWLWNGMRGGLLVPSSEMEVSGLSQSAFIEQWKARGADIEKIKKGDYFAYDLQGFYQFSTVEKDQNAGKKLRDYVSFLVEDAPALASSINPLTPIRSTNLSLEYKKSIQGKAKQFTVLANAGKNLTRTPVLMVDFGKDKGKLLLSQLLTAGRLNSDFEENTKYGIRYDEVAVQMVLNMMNTAIE